MIQNILITGSSTGIGRAMAEGLARQGHRVFASMRDPAGKNAPHAEALQKLAQQEDLPIRVVELDVSNEDSVQSAVRQVIEIAGRVDVVINNAGIMVLGVAEAISIDQYRHMFDVNVLGAMRVNQAVLPHMRRQGSGLLIYTSSVGATLCYPFMGLYGSTKSAMAMMAEAMHYEVYSLGIDTVILQAGGFSTALGENVQRNNRSEVWAEYATVGQIATGFAEGFAQSLSPSANIAGDTKIIADAVATQIALPHGQRQLHLPVGPYSEGLLVINPAVASIQNYVLPGLGLSALLVRPEKKVDE